MSIEAKLSELGIELPPPPPAVAAYEPWMRTGNLVLTSGQLPWRWPRAHHVNSNPAMAAMPTHTHASSAHRTRGEVTPTV